VPKKYQNLRWKLFLPRICQYEHKVHHLLDGDDPVLVCVREPEYLSWDAARGEDPVEGVGGDGVILTDEIRDRLKQLHDVCPLVAVPDGTVVSEKENDKL
jgi:hypothetical protein